MKNIDGLGYMCPVTIINGEAYVKARELSAFVTDLKLMRAEVAWYKTEKEYWRHQFLNLAKSM